MRTGRTRRWQAGLTALLATACGTATRSSGPEVVVERAGPGAAERAADRGPETTAGTSAASTGSTGASAEQATDETGAAVLEPPPPQPPFLELAPGSLDDWFAALRAVEADGADRRALVTIFGDSHTAGDRMTARLRQVLAARFGDGGRGLVAMGKPPIRHYYQTEVRYGSTGKWKAAVGGHRDDHEPFGLAGLRVMTKDRRASSWVETCDACAFGGRVARFELLYWAQPGGAKLRYRVDAQKWRTVGTALTGGATSAHPARAVIPVPDGRHRLTVEQAGAGALALFGVVLERDRAGVVIDGLGVVGRTLPQLASWDWSVIGAQLAERRPRLVILQYGTNEAEDADLDLAALARRYDQVIARVRAAVPGASILLLGPPDLAVRDAGKACDDPRRGALAEPQDPLAEPVAVEPACQWHTPPRLLGIVAVQREAARRNHAAFFDTLSALGGPERMDAMVTATPPLAAGDHVHLTSLGYQRWADALLAELLAAFEASTTAEAPPTTPPPAAAPAARADRAPAEP